MTRVTDCRLLSQGLLSTCGALRDGRRKKKILEMLPRIWPRKHLSYLVGNIYDRGKHWSNFSPLSLCVLQCVMCKFPFYATCLLLQGWRMGERWSSQGWTLAFTSSFDSIYNSDLRGCQNREEVKKKTCSALDNSVAPLWAQRLLQFESETESNRFSDNNKATRVPKT